VESVGSRGQPFVIVYGTSRSLVVDGCGRDGEVLGGRSGVQSPIPHGEHEAR
jgi:hypothetical protein